MTQGSTSRTWTYLDDPKAARMLTDARARRFLEPLIGQEKTVREIAEELSVSMSSVLYRVRQFTALGLVRVQRSEARRGRLIKYYRSVKDGFFVPFEVTPLEAQEALSPHIFSELQRVLNLSIGQAWLGAAGEQPLLGLHIYRSESGFLNQNIVPDPDADQPHRFYEGLLEPEAPAVWDTWGSLELSQVDAKALQTEIAALLGRYRSVPLAKGRKTHIVRLAMAPQQKE